MSATLQAERIRLGGGLHLTQEQENGRLTLTLTVTTDADCLLHWGLSRRPGGAWQQPPENVWPAGTVAFDARAVRTPLVRTDRGERAVTIPLELPCPWRQLSFVVYFPRENRWLKNDGRDFAFPLPAGCGPADPEAALARWAPQGATDRKLFTLDGGERLAAAIQRTGDAVHVRFACDADPPLVLHWGLAWQFRHEWALPPEDLRPAGTSVFDQLAVHTPFTEREGLLYLDLDFPATDPRPRGLKFVLHQPQTGAWLKSGGKDQYLTLFEPAADPCLGSPKLRDLAEQIVVVEKGDGSWSLMHRFQLCHDLLGEVADDEDGLALLYAWLRYSATRQLDWQRRYNTKPRELSHAQDRLTARLAGLWRRQAPGAGPRRWLRLLLTTLGRGGDGQRVRDEILHIMHRHHIKETTGHFIEEWHQKLHNNTTPDDVVLCEAYLAFLRSNGDRGKFYQVLEAGGVTRERLQSFERPIRSEPDFFADKKDGLIPDFEHFLRILKSVHAGTDLETAAGVARGRLDGEQNRKLDAVFSLRGQQNVKDLAAAVAAAREGLRKTLEGSQDDAAVRDLLFLDLALEEVLRGAIERQNLSRLDRDTLVDLVNLTLRSLSLSCESAELGLCAGHWAALCGMRREGRDWALHAKSVADRAGRWLQGWTDALYQRLQPKAQFLGAAFGAASWVVSLFSEEVVRAGPAFALALLLRHLDPLLRKAAGLGGWQVISPGRAAGQVRHVERLLAVQGERFAQATVLITDAVTGTEEIPEGVTAVLTRDTPDLVSHVAVRARNAHVLFATCFEPETYERLKALKDRTIVLRITPSGEVQFEEGTSAPTEAAARAPEPVLRAAPRRDDRWVVTQDQFHPDIVGGKACNLNGLRGRLPEWVHLPTSLALPFGAFEKVLQHDANRAFRRQYETLLASVEHDPPHVLAQMRELLLGLVPPPGLQEVVLAAWQRASLPSVAWDHAWRALQRVWASKWNERAYLSRRARHVPHERLLMAVLIQQVVPADYAYVIHTTNPLTGNRDEIYAEVVLGLGETLVGNYPGRALGFVCRKNDMQPEVLSYPGKSIGLYGKGVIFRSDSNGEDLEGFAGAGLYDSFLAEEPEQRRLDYRGEKLVWDSAFRAELLRSIARVGLEVERVLGTPQDIEGAVAGGQFHLVQTRPQVGLTV